MRTEEEHEALREYLDISIDCPHGTGLTIAGLGVHLNMAT